ncbi:hypothetical protein ACGGAQ_32280 [Micromonospora sp. NPDC047557]|uniref:hypothetical protein n=1 Tax=Micromonospora sp. NPDC047557 TaxID=3364250 RepID=UPI0037234918
MGAVVVGLILADVLYRWVELPAIGVGRRLAARVARPVSRDDDRPVDTVVDGPRIPRPREVLADTVPTASGRAHHHA